MFRKNERADTGLSFLVRVCLLALAGLVAFSAAPFFRAEAARLFTIEDSATPLAKSAAKVYVPEASGKTTHSGGGATVDVSNAADGYIMAKFSGSSKKIKLRITKSGKSTYTYDVSGGGGYQAFPLTNGDGKYKIEVFEQVSGNQYSQALTCSVDAKLSNQLLPFLYPSVMVSFTKDSDTVKQGNSLASGAATDLDVVSQVYNFVISNISYDNDKAAQVAAGKLSGYIPKVDSILKSRKGICFDYAAVMATMLRSQGIPTRMEFGYVSGGVYHAWISTYLKDTGWVNGVIQFDGKKWTLMDPTFASGGNAKYVGSGSNYSVKYMY